MSDKRYSKNDILGIYEQRSGQSVSARTLNGLLARDRQLGKRAQLQATHQLGRTLLWDEEAKERVVNAFETPTSTSPKVVSIGTMQGRYKPGRGQSDCEALLGCDQAS